ncbi:amidohydrolase [Candidatus Bathyarchaeota archaeon]|nr:MAG: amidohydrolase [Candidatus Bathyarchaeota archaeon]
MDLIVKGGTVITMGPKGVIRDGAIVIEDEHIIDVGKAREITKKYSGYDVLYAKDRVIIPGLINTHQHIAMSLLRGYADDYPLKEWLERWIWPLERCLSEHDIYVGALLTAVESLMGGITTINTMYHFVEGGGEARGLADAGLRGVVGHVCFSWRKDEDKRSLETLAKEWHGRSDGCIRVSVDPHAPYTVDPQFMVELKEIKEELNRKYGSSTNPIIWHIHLAETDDEPEKVKEAFNVEIKGSVVRYLDSLNVLGEDVIAAHCVSINEEDIEILKRRNVKVSHCPISNLKLASGVSPVPELIAAGVTVSLGTDGPSSNNTSDMFEVMKFTALLHKGVKRDPTLLPAETVFRMATIDGAKALLWDREIGSIEVGKKADIVILNFEKPHLKPLYNEYSHLVYAAKASDVETVIVNGKVVMEERDVKTVNVPKVLEEAEHVKDDLLSRLPRNKR